MKNRAQRRAEKSMFAKELKNAKFDEWEDMTSTARESTLMPPKMGKFIGFYKNSIYSVQIYQRDEMTLLGIRRHDQKASCPWVHKQRIKNELIGKDIWAVEVFPSEERKVDQANMYWLWCYPKGERPGFSL